MLTSARFLTLLSLLSHHGIFGRVVRDAHESEEEECCEQKTVGEFSYTLAGTNAAAWTKGCISDCVYTKDEDPSGSKFCFAPGRLEVECQDEEEEPEEPPVEPSVGTRYWYCGDDCKTIAGYLTGSDVTEHNELDLDQRDLEDYLAEGDFDKATQIYSQGGNSQKTHTVTLSAPLDQDYNEGDEITQGSAVGLLHSDAKNGTLTLRVGITSTCTGESAKDSDASGCFTSGSSLSIKGEDVGNVESVQLSWRTIEKFTTEAEQKMTGQPTFDLYNAYYDQGDYAHEFITTALDGTGEFDGKSNEFRAEFAAKASEFWSIWMYIIRELEDAVDDCNAEDLERNDAPVHAWDEAWAFYAGSLEGTEKGGNSAGRLNYREAEDLSTYFNTTGPDSVNTQLLELYDQGKDNLKKGKCDETRDTILYQIVDLMTVPLIQGTLRAAYNYEQSDKHKAQAASFLGAFLPRLDECSSTDAATVKDKLWIDSSFKSGDYNVVKKALENNYECMGVTCAQVGGFTGSPVC